LKYSFQTGLLFFLCVAATFAKNTVLAMDSEPGDYIGGGDNYYYCTPAEGAFSASQNYDNGVSISFANGSHNWGWMTM
jgi:hypothetical protein